MDANEKGLYLDALLNFEPHFINPETRFWMVRTKKGYFYKEFVTKNFIALGWNIITNKTSITESTKDSLMYKIKEVYGNKRPNEAINKCQNFIREMKNGDIVIIPNANSAKITFATVGDYYEDDRFGYEKEIEVNDEINSFSGTQSSSVECPYVKRRHIEILKTVRANKINMHLMKAISNYHGISCMDKYSKIILDEIYSTYFFNGISSLQVAINSESNLNAVAVTKLLASVMEIMSMVFDENQLTLSINLNSPGKFSMSEQKDSDQKKTDLLRQGFKVFKSTKTLVIVLGILVIATGGEYKDFKANGIAQVVKDIATLPTDIEIKKQELKGKELENLEKQIAIYETLQESNIDVDKIYKNIEEINKISEKLEIGYTSEATMENDDDIPIYMWDEISEEDD